MDVDERLTDAGPSFGDDWHLEDEEQPGLDGPLDPRMAFIRSYHGPVDEASGAWEASLAAGIAPRAARFQLLSGDALRSLPEPTYSVDGKLVTGTTVEWYGRQGSYKSFGVVDLSCCMATGRAWQGNAILQSGPVVYVAAENHRGTAKRYRAWERYHGVRTDRFHMLPEPLLLLRPNDVLAFVDDVAQQVGQAPVAVVFDTLSRCIPGANENAQEVMSAAVASIDVVLRRFPDAVAIAVHHTGLVGKHSRGSTSFPYACDTQILCQREPGELVASITITKQREGDEGAEMSVHLELVPEEHSAVLVAAKGVAAAPVPKVKVKPRSRNQRAALHALMTLGKPSAYSAWRAKTSLPGSTFDDAKVALSSLGMVEQKPSGDWFVTDKGRGQVTFGPEWQL